MNSAKARMTVLRRHCVWGEGNHDGMGSVMCFRFQVGLCALSVSDGSAEGGAYVDSKLLKRVA